MKSEGVYVGLSDENIVVILDLFTKGVFIISTVDNGRVLPLGLGEYKLLNNEFIIEPQRAWIFMLPNPKRIIGEIIPKSVLKFNGITAYYHASIRDREPYVIYVDDVTRNPMPERYGKDVINSLSGFDFLKHDFDGYNLNAALEAAGIDAEKLRNSSGDESFFRVKSDVKSPLNRALLYDNVTGKKIPGAYFDEHGELKYRPEVVKRFISHEEAAATGNWSNVSYNLKADQEQEIKRVATMNHEILDRINGTYTNEKQYDVFSSPEEMLQYAGIDENDPLRESLTTLEEKTNPSTTSVVKNDDQAIVTSSDESLLNDVETIKEHDVQEGIQKEDSKMSVDENNVNSGVLPLVYCFGYQKIYFFAGKYHYLVMFLLVQDKEAKKMFLTTIDDDKRNLEGWREVIKRVAQDINEAKYLLFRDTTFNFNLETNDILPETVLCKNIADIDYREDSRNESVALADQISQALTDFRIDASMSLQESFIALMALLKDMKIKDIKII
jgi:hypothetical protein